MVKEQFILIVTEKFRKGVDVRVIGRGTQAQVERQRSETKFAGRRGQPFIIKASEEEAFRKQHLKGIFAPKFDPAKARVEEAAKIRRQKEQSRFERIRTTAKLPTPAGELARQKLKAEFGIGVKAPPPIKTLTSEDFQKSLLARQRTLQTLEKQEEAKLQARIKDIGLAGVKAEEVTRRARETRTAQLRATGAEVIFKPSEKFFANKLF